MIRASEAKENCELKKREEIEARVKAFYNTGVGDKLSEMIDLASKNGDGDIKVNLDNFEQYQLDEIVSNYFVLDSLGYEVSARMDKNEYGSFVQLIVISWWR